MIYTNGAILIDSKNDPDALAKAVRKLTRFLEEDRALEAKIILDDTVPYPCYLLPENVTFQDIDQALRPQVQLRAINEDIVVLPEKKSISIKHYYTQEELDHMGASMAAKLVEKKRLEAKRKAVMSEFNANINALDGDIDELADHHQQGWEERDILCQVKLNFGDDTRYYIDAADPEHIVKGEPLETKDYQMRIDVFVEPLHDPLIATPALEPFLTGDVDEEPEDDPNDGPADGPELGEYSEGDDPTSVI